MNIMKWGIIYLFLVVAYKVVMWCAPIWAIVSFVLYLVKDKPFDWTPVYVFFGGLLLYLLVVVFALLYQNRLEKKMQGRHREAFQKRLQELMGKQNSMFNK